MPPSEMPQPWRDVYVANPAGGATSTAASFPGRNYSIDAGSAWNRLIEVQGFGGRFVDADRLPPRAERLHRHVAVRPEPAASNPRTQTILLVDDEPAARAALHRLVVAMGHDGVLADRTGDRHGLSSGQIASVIITSVVAASPRAVRPAAHEPLASIMASTVRAASRRRTRRVRGRAGSSLRGQRRCWYCAAS